MNTTITRATATAVGLALAAAVTVSCSATKEATKDMASSATSVASSAASAAETAASSAAAAATGTTTLYYPTQDASMFSIEAPADWTVGKIDQVGDFGSVESPNGSILQFRAQKYNTDTETKAEIDAIVDSTMEFLKDNYTDVALGDPTDIDVSGQPGLEVAGTGKDKDGNAVQFLSAMIMLGPNSLAEIWAAVMPEGNSDLDTAKAVLDSFKPTPS